MSDSSTGEPGDTHSPNGHGGVPPMEALAPFVTVRVTLEGPIDPQSAYVRNIKDIDDAVRDVALPRVREAINRPLAPLVLTLLDDLGAALTPAQSDVAVSPVRVVGVSLAASPFQSVSAFASEPGMTRLSQKFEFSAAHRLHNPALSDDDNRRLFGKCNNPLGHGHNYELQVTLAGVPDGDGRLMATSTLERLVDDVVLKRFDHKHLNAETAEFANLIPSVENIARVIFDLLKPQLDGKLASVTVWETPKTWCEYAEKSE